ncbi:hypothetical protein AAFF_G00156750 [Aldrovandia affinis]|uniref:Lipoxygenase domain-containing protein n=1 Tax=Aldrovandia affinis TaxID=143900 RepID=A0AAD7RNM3_9TELE|nr:hypothetical protein AAFF_G00156750 [Aldrovandia affinis]
MHINIIARKTFISEDGVFTKLSVIGGEEMLIFLRRAFSVTYSSLCLPEDITARGLESVPNFYYRDDGLRLWDIINRFVEGMVRHYYPCDGEVQQDSELQSWIKEIFTHGFLEQSCTGIPQCFSSVEEVIKFITMVIFTVSVQHSAVNGGQFDFTRDLKTLSHLGVFPEENFCEHGPLKHVLALQEELKVLTEGINKRKRCSKAALPLPVSGAN